MPKLTLYYKPTCPFCIKVLEYLQDKKITVTLKNTSDESYQQELLKIGGQKQVPCLVIDGKALYESDDIINWFEKQK